MNKPRNSRGGEHQKRQKKRRLVWCEEEREQEEERGRNEAVEWWGEAGWKGGRERGRKGERKM